MPCTREGEPEKGNQRREPEKGTREGGYLAGIPDVFHEAPITVEDKEILVVEGCQTLHSSLVPHLDLRIWLDTDPEVCLERGIRRDIYEYELDPDRVNAAWSEWSAWEAESLARDDRRKRADIIL